MKCHEKRDLLSKRVLWQRPNWCAATHRQKVTEIIILLIGNLGRNDALNFYGIHSDSIQIPELFKRRFLAWVRNHDRNNLDGYLILCWTSEKVYGLQSRKCGPIHLVMLCFSRILTDLNIQRQQQHQQERNIKLFQLSPSIPSGGIRTFNRTVD